MVALNNIRSRLKAVDNIKKITSSMEMVASARLRKAQDRARKAQFYVAKLRGILERLEDSSTDYKHPLFEKRVGKKIVTIHEPAESLRKAQFAKVGIDSHHREAINQKDAIPEQLLKIGVVIVASDRGLCGAYNTRVFDAADAFLKPGMELILVGRKAVQYYQRQQWKIRRQWNGWSGKASFLQVREFTDQLLQDFLKKQLDEVWLVYTQFHNLMRRQVVVEKFLPIGKPAAQKNSKSLNYIFEPDLDEIYEQIIVRYCATQIETMLDQAHASELAARIFAMKAASKNAEEMHDSLTLERNKVRQSNITRELLEITQG